jgi:hypothetical protein
MLQKWKIWVECQIYAFLRYMIQKIKLIEGYLEAPALTDIEAEYTPEFSNNNSKAIDFLDKRKKDTYSFLLD